MFLTLHRNIQFIYELVLAQVELDVFGVEYEVENNLRSFRVLSELNVNRFAKRCAYFKEIDGKLSDYHFIQQFNQTGSINQYLTHWFYPYKGKFHPQMIRALCNIIRLKEGDFLLDPFVGSGTAALEAQLLGINLIGIDISPLCVLQSKVKVNSIYVLDKITELRHEICPIGSNIKSNPQSQLLFKGITYEDIEDPNVRNFYELAEMIAYSDSQRRHKDFSKSFYSNVAKMIASVKDYQDMINKLHINLGDAELLREDTRQLSLSDNSVDGIITSPPYSIALNYVKNDAHTLEAMGNDLETIQDEFIGVRGHGFERFELYNKDMEQCFKHMYRVLKPGRYCVVVIGNVTYQGKKVRTSEWAKEACKKAGFDLIKEINKIIFGLYNVIQEEFIQIYRKTD